MHLRRTRCIRHPAPLTNFLVPQHMQYVEYTCFHFGNALFVVPGPAPRWKCPNYHPERSLLAPASSFQLTNLKSVRNLKEARTHGAHLQQRDIFLYFKATCLQRPLEESFTADDMRFKACPPWCPVEYPLAGVISANGAANSWWRFPMYMYLRMSVFINGSD